MTPQLRFLALRIWPVVVATQLIITAYYGATITDPFTEHLFDVAAVAGVVLILLSAIVPESMILRAASVGTVTGAMFGRAVWAAGWSTLPFPTRIVAAAAYQSTAAAALAIGLGSSIIVVHRSGTK